jgi:Rrf2 family nitric oxide-sensitive transcriptional repressor
MRLTLHTDYALRMLMYLALHRDRRSTIEEIAQVHGISRNHLMKVALTLGRERIIDSARGRNGGLVLARAPDAISIGAVVRATEDNFDLVECFDGATDRCAISSACLLKRPFARAIQSFLAVLDGYTLADMTAAPATRRDMRSLLRLT